MGNKNLPKLTHGYLRCNKIPTRRSLLRQTFPIWAKRAGAFRFTSKPHQQLLAESSTGVDHTRASPEDTNPFDANGSCSTRGFHWKTGRRLYDDFYVTGMKLVPESDCTLYVYLWWKAKAFI